MIRSSQKLQQLEMHEQYTSTCLLAYTKGSSSADFSSIGDTLTLPATAMPFFASCRKKKSQVLGDGGANLHVQQKASLVHLVS